MSPHARAGLALASVMACAAAHAQTIADYSRAQRTLLESTMAQAAARSANLGASAPASPAPAAATATPVLASASPTPRPSPMPGPPALQVSGVFASTGGVMAEVLVNATPYLLMAGQGVPGTAWQVESIAVDRVVLGRHGGSAVDAEGTRRVFALPTLR